MVTPESHNEIAASNNLFEAESIPFASTNSFSALVNAYLRGDEKLRPFFESIPGLEGIQQSITTREKYAGNRKLISQYLKDQYSGLVTTNAVEENISRLLDSNCFTVCTAHQPNIFTGHLYFVYKIIHAIVLADKLNKELPQYQFVPVYYMGSEDADLQELGEVTIEGKKYNWNTKQTGAVGRMKVDKELLEITAAIKNQLLVKPYGQEVMALVERVYTVGKTIQQATLELVNELFGKYGLLVFLPDDARVKQEFFPVAERELQQQFSSQAVDDTIEKFPAEFKVQTAGREINLFYLTNDARERIEKEEYNFRIGKEIFSSDQLLENFSKNPETISPNVVLRPVFQEMILPNVAFIGGGGELAYWLELKQVFEAAGVPFPVLILRNSFLILNERAAEIMKDLALEIEDLFKPENILANEYILKQEGENIKLDEYRQRLKELYNLIGERAAGTDITLKQHTESLFTKADKRIELLEKKMIRAVRMRDAVSMNKIAKLKSMVYPGGNLQERIDNFLTYYSLYGPQWLDVILSNSPAFSDDFIILKQKG